MSKLKTSAVVLVFNSSGELALQKRAAHDSSYPLHWDFSAAGGIDKGEDPKAAAIRELQEEIGVISDIEYITNYTYEDKTSVDELYIYRTTSEGPFKPAPGEVAEVKFFSMPDIEKMLEGNEQFHPEFVELWGKGIIK